MDTNVFKQDNLIWWTIKKIMLSFIVSLGITFVVSIMFGFKYRLVGSGSMEPAIPTYSLIATVKTPYEELEIGDIITYRVGNLTFTHRVVEFAENGNVITAGDANINSATGIPSRDGEIPKERYEGKYVFQLAPIGELIMFMKQNIMICGILIMLGFFTYSVVVD